MGAYSTALGANSSAACTLCAAGNYSSLPGAGLCSLCPGNSSSQAGGSQCTAVPGYYLKAILVSYASSAQSGTMALPGSANALAVDMFFTAPIPANMLTVTLTASLGVMTATNPSFAFTLASLPSYMPILYKPDGTVRAPVLWYPFNSAYGLADASGGNNPATSLGGTVTCTNQMILPGVFTISPLRGDLFAPVSNTQCLGSPFGGIEKIQQSTGVSISFWINMLRINTGWVLVFATFFNGNSQESGFILLAGPSGLSIRLAGMVDFYWMSPALTSDGLWHHIVMTWDTGNNFMAWQDGVQVEFMMGGGGSRTTVLTGMGLGTATRPYYAGLGTNPILGDPCAWVSTAGYSDLRVYGHVFSLDDVQTLYSGRVDAVWSTTQFPACPYSCPAQSVLHCSPAGAPVCCVSGQVFSEGVSTACQDCLPGSYLASASTCLQCPVGSYSAQARSLSCTLCGAGTYGSQAGVSACLACAAGAYSTAVGALSAAVCSPCPVGTYSNTTGLSAAAACSNCTAGTYSNGTGQLTLATCTACRAGTYSSAAGASAAGTCTACLANSGSSAGAWQCTANVGYYQGMSVGVLATYTQSGAVTLPAGTTQLLLNKASVYDVPSSMLSVTISANSGFIQASNPVYSFAASTLPATLQDLFMDNGTTRRPVMWHPFNSTHCLTDASGNNYQLTSKGGASGVCQNQYNSQVSPRKGDMFIPLGGSGQYLTSTFKGIGKMQSTTGVSVSFWFRSLNNGEMRTSMADVLFFHCGNGAFAGGFKFLLSYKGPFTFTYTQNCFWAVPATTSGWNHYVLAWNTQGTHFAWMDGNIVPFYNAGTSNPTDNFCPYASLGDDTYTAYTTINADPLDVLLSRQTNGGNDFFSDLRVYNYLMSLTDVQTLYSGRVDALGPSLPMLYKQCMPSSCPAYTFLHCSPSGTAVCCGVGQWFAEGSSTVCQNCSAGTSSDGSGSSCLFCVVGSYVSGQTCLNCTAGTYSLQTGVSACAACDAGSYSSGLAQSSPAVCIVCTPGKYSPTAGAISASNCTACPANSNTSAGAVSLAQCLCLAGYVGDARLAGGCAQCPLNYYCAGGAANLSTACSVGTFSPAGASAAGECGCPGNATNVSGVGCVCAGGYQRVSSVGALGGWNCTACGANVYCALGALAACPAHSTAPALSASAGACGCDPGYYSSGGACALCPPNSYCLAGLLVACPANTTSGQGASLQTDCRCVAGFRCVYTGDYQLRLVFLTDLATFLQSEATLRAQVAAAAGVPVSSVVLNATMQTGARRRMLEVRAYAPVWRAGEQELVLA
jgi:hypothetical protein